MGATGLAGAIAAEQILAQETNPTQPSSPSSVPVASSRSDRELAGKVALVTGARANMGRAFAEALARNGADVVIHYHREETRSTNPPMHPSRRSGRFDNGKSLAATGDR